VELGNVIAEAEAPASPSDRAEILRAAGAEDHATANRLQSERHARFEEFRRIFDDGVWPIEPIDVEPLLEEGRLVLHYLGPHKLDLAGLRAALRVSSGLDLVFEPAGLDVSEAQPEPEVEAEAEAESGCGSCGSNGGGCGSSSGKKSGGCAGCAVGDLVAKRRRRAPSLA
jgi:hypothetical protein